jgi:sugar phosphate isomerase/epimerase
MKLAAITDEISQDFVHALDVLAEYRVDAAELRGLWGTNIADLTPEQVERARAALSLRGFKVVCLATPFYKCDLESETGLPAERGPLHLAPARGLEQQFELLKRCIQLAHAFDTRLIRVFAFWRKAVLTPDIEDRIVEAFAAPVALAAQEGVTLVLENEHACMIGSGAEAAHLLARINSPHLRACWDPGNAFSLGEVAYPDGYNAVRPWVAHVHVKDARMIDTPDHGQQARFCVMGEGEMDYAGQFAALERDGYEGYVSLETHYVPQHGTGADGRGTPEDGSRPCLEYLRRAADAFAIRD